MIVVYCRTTGAPIFRLNTWAEALRLERERDARAARQRGDRPMIRCYTRHR